LIFWSYTFIESGEFPVYFDETTLRNIGINDEMKLWFIRENQKKIYEKYMNQICWVTDEEVRLSDLFVVMALDSSSFDSYTIQNILSGKGISTKNKKRSMELFGEFLGLIKKTFKTSLEDDLKRFGYLKRKKKRTPCGIFEVGD